MDRFSQYFNMARFYIAALILTFCQASNAELTSSDQTQVDETQITEPSTDVYSENTCTRIETQFQNYIINIMDSAISTSSKSYHCLMGGIRNNSPDCKKINSMNLGNLKKYRRSLKKLYQEMANHWVKEKSKQDPRFKACLGLPVRFERNIRRVRTKLPYYRCQPIITRWSHELDQLTQEYLGGKRTITSLNSEEIASLKAFHHSPLKRIISTNALFDSRLNNSELKQKLASAYNTIRIGTEKLKKKVSKLKDRQKYILFDFQNQFTAFTNTLPPQTRPKATRCIKSSGFFRDCTINVSKQGSRCGSRIWRLGKEMLPVIPLIDSIKGTDNVMAAEASGIMTSSEASQKRAELATLGILGLGGITGGVSLLAKPLVRSTVRTSAVKTGSSKTTTRSNDSSALLRSQKKPSGESRKVLDLKKGLISSHNKATTHLEEMGIDYSPVSGIDSYIVDEIKRRNRSIKDGFITLKNGDPPDLIDLSDIPVQAQGVLRIRTGATRRKRHTNPRGLALEHKNIDARIKEAEEMGVKVVIDTSLDRKGDSVLAYFSPRTKILAIRPDSDWLIFEHELQHALFENYLIAHVLRDAPFNSVRILSKSGQSLKQMRQQLPDQVRKNWSKKEQNVILRYMRDDMPGLALNERLSTNRELEMLGWRRYTPMGRVKSNYATSYIIEGLENGTKLTTQQRSILEQAHITDYTLRFGADAAAEKYGKDSVKTALETYGKYSADPTVKKYGKQGKDPAVREYGEETALEKLYNELVASWKRNKKTIDAEKDAGIAERAEKYGASTIVGTGAGLGLSGAAAEIETDPAQREESFLSKLPRNIRSAIQSAKEVFYSERGILVRNQNGQAQFFPSEKKE